jgi:hypothetical protein
MIRGRLGLKGKNQDGLNDFKTKKKPSQPDQGEVDLAKRKRYVVIGLSADVYF